MKESLVFIVILAALGLFCPGAEAQLVINEVMQSNIDCIMDDLNEFPDSWVELYNPGENEEQLGLYLISDSNDPQSAYKLPTKIILPGEYVVIYCDKVSNDMHTNFRIDSGKGASIYLFKDEEEVDKLENLKKQPAPNIAYGRKTENSNEFGYQAKPTPGSPNCNILCKTVLGEPIFSHHGVISNENFDLVLSLPSDAPEQTEIRYTLDGSEPDVESRLYDGPIDIDSTTVVRAKLFCEGYLSPRSTTHSYIHHPRRVTLPIVSIVTNYNYFYDDEVGIYVDGSYSETTPNYKYDWRRPINFEYFAADGVESSINQLCETRVKGGATRKMPLKSLALYANKRFGEKRFNYEFFPDQTPGISEFKSFEMRNSGNDFTGLYFKDAAIQRSMGMYVDLDWQPVRPVVVYVNGEYKGILNIRPRSNEDYLYSYYDGLEDVDVIENYWGDVKNGTIDNFNAFKEFYSSEHTFAEYEGIMDIGEYCNYMILNIFYNNIDFPGNNMVLWRPVDEGGRWRWICKDLDMTLFSKNYDYPTLTWITVPNYDYSSANSEKAICHFCSMINMPEFREMFIEHLLVYLGDFLTPEKINSVFDTLYDETSTEHKFHHDLYNPNSATQLMWLKSAKNWIISRHDYFFNHMSQFFELPLMSPLSISCKTEEGVEKNDYSIVINGIKLKSDSFNGRYVPGRQLNIEIPKHKHTVFSGSWQVEITKGDETQTVIYDTEPLSIPMPEGDNVNITYIPYNPTSLATEMLRDTQAEQVRVYDISGRYMFTTKDDDNFSKRMNSGVYFLKKGNTTLKVMVK